MNKIICMQSGLHTRNCFEELSNYSLNGIKVGNWTWNVGDIATDFSCKLVNLFYYVEKNTWYSSTQFLRSWITTLEKLNVF